jgi:RHS repeat-associated protein
LSLDRTTRKRCSSASNRTRLTFPDTNYIDYDPDALNRIWKIRENGATSGVGVLATLTWDPMSRRDASTRGNGTSTNFDYDAASRLILLTQDLTGSTKDLTRSFTHNAAGQIRTRATTGTTYDYQAPLANKTYVPDGLNRYASVASTSFTYDANGNLTSDSTRTFLYDVENRLIRVTTGGVQTDLSYDPLGRLYSVVTPSNTTQFLYEGDRLIAEYVGSPTPTLQRRYVHGPGVDEPVVWYEGSGLTTRHWLHADERGSIIATSDSGGNGTEYKYGPYGEPTSWSGVRFRYTGQIALSDLQLYHYKARVYDPVLGRFLQTDPVGYKDDNNLYCYVAGDPLNRTDPTGTEGPLFHTKDRGPCTCQGCCDVKQLKKTAGFVADWLPGVSDVKGGVEFFQDPSILGGLAAVVGIVPIFGDAAAKGLKTLDKALDAAPAVKKVSVSKTKNPEAFENASASGNPSGPFTVDRAGRDQRRADNLRGQSSAGAGRDNDEWPMAMTREGDNARVAPVASGQNRSVGATVGNSTRKLNDGDQFEVEWVDE